MSARKRLVSFSRRHRTWRSAGMSLRRVESLIPKLTTTHWQILWRNISLWWGLLRKNSPRWRTVIFSRLIWWWWSSCCWMDHLEVSSDLWWTSTYLRLRLVARRSWLAVRGSDVSTAISTLTDPNVRSGWILIRKKTKVVYEHSCSQRPKI